MCPNPAQLKCLVDARGSALWVGLAVGDVKEMELVQPQQAQNQSSR
jgi:hypothetical protein